VIDTSPQSAYAADALIPADTQSPAVKSLKFMGLSLFEPVHQTGVTGFLPF
jgi:hypothetical protein